MAYLEYETYRAHGGTLNEEGFSKWEPRAEILFDSWTLNRMQSAKVVADLKQLGSYDKTLTALSWLTDQCEGIDSANAAKAKGQEVKSFNNGVNSFSFGDSAESVETAAEAVAFRQVVKMLPVELCSACVSYNDAR